MHSIRTNIATAALLLAPVAALVAAQPAAAQERHADYRAVRFDHRAPQVFDVTPNQGQRVSDRGRTTVSARFADDASGVDLRSVTLKIDHRDVTRHARVNGSDVRYSADLQPGRHSAELVLRDRAGNVTHRSWTFAVADRGTWHRS